ncbi:MAG: hypothetical protein AAF689_11710 [Pseudomonadota bacterium]
MDLISLLADFLLLVAALGAATYCMVLSRRLSRLNSIDKGLGGAIAVLSAQVDDLTKALSDARAGSEATAERLAALNEEAHALTNDMEEMLAVSHDLAPAEAEFGSRRARTEEDAGEMPVFRRRAVQQAAE